MSLSLVPSCQHKTNLTYNIIGERNERNYIIKHHCMFFFMTYELLGLKIIEYFYRLACAN